MKIRRRLDPAGWAAGTPEPLLKIPTAVPLDLLIFGFLVLLCAILVFFIRGSRPRPACLRRSFFTHCPEQSGLQRLRRRHGLRSRLPAPRAPLRRLRQEVQDLLHGTCIVVLARKKNTLVQNRVALPATIQKRTTCSLGS